MTYTEKLRSPQWQKKRLQILERDNWQCCSCGDSQSNLQVHHLLYARRDPWDYPDDVYQTLCENCHKERQELTDKIIDAIRLSLKNVPTLRLEIVANRLFSEAMEEMA
jgi:5-methylcytosine-specific restriction endonuclease McrA